MILKTSLLPALPGGQENRNHHPLWWPMDRVLQIPHTSLSPICQAPLCSSPLITMVVAPAYSASLTQTPHQQHQAPVLPYTGSAVPSLYLGSSSFLCLRYLSPSVFLWQAHTYAERQLRLTEYHFLSPKLLGFPLLQHPPPHVDNVYLWSTSHSGP